MARPPRSKPNDGVGAEWVVTRRPDPTAEVTRRFVVNVRNAMGGSSVRATAKLAGVDHTALTRMLAGETWPDAVMIAKLERAFKRTLWPGVLWDE